MLWTLAAVLFSVPDVVYADLDGDGAFVDSSWSIAFEDTIQKPIGVVQSVTATDDYIITIENTDDSQDVPDTVSAYYRNPVDENGSPVQQYSLAMRTESYNWEHGNGMTWNPNTGKIYVAFYTNKFGDHAGCIQEMDPNTLEPGELIRIGDGSYNILGIAYKKDTDQYVIQTDGSDGYRIKLLDNQFRIIDDFGPQDTTPGGNFQDMEVDGDYVMIYVMTYGLGIGEWLDVFSLSQRQMVLNTSVSLADTEGLQITEAEGMVELDPGHFLSVVTVTEGDGQRKVRFYETHVPYLTPPPEIQSEAESVPEAVSEVSSAANPVVTDTPAIPDPGEADAITVVEIPTRMLLKAISDGAAQVFFYAGDLMNRMLKGSTTVKEAAGTLGSQFLANGRHLLVRIRAFHMPLWAWTVLFGCGAVLMGPGMLLYMVHVRRARKRINAKVKRLRRQVIRQMQAEVELSESVETWTEDEQS